MFFGIPLRSLFRARWTTAVLYGIGPCVIFFLNCVQYARYVPDPEKDIEQWIANFTRQRSFSYEYETKLKSVSVEATGYCVIGKGERLSGTWYGPGGAQKFDYVGLGDIEYLKKGSAWERISRGEESDIFTQIVRILTTDTFEYKGGDGDFTYRFRANVPFLDPERRKDMIGFITVSSDNFLPKYIWAGLPDSTTYWTARLSGYNSARGIKPPVKEMQEYLVIPNTRSTDDYAKLKRRLELLSVESRLEQVDNGFLLRLDEYLGLEDVMEMLRPGGMALYEATGDREKAAKTAYLLGDMYRPLYLTGRFATEGDIRRIDIGFDRSSKPYVSLKLRKKYALRHLVALEVDTILAATAALDTLAKSDRIDLYPEMKYSEMEFLRAYILQPLGAFEVQPSPGERR
jgi:hypothetical protein